MKVKALSIDELNKLILGGADRFEIINEVHVWEMVNGRKFIYPYNGKNCKSASIMYLHPDFGWVPELR